VGRICTISAMPRMTWKRAPWHDHVRSPTDPTGGPRLPCSLPGKPHGYRLLSTNGIPGQATRASGVGGVNCINAFQGGGCVV
jgi:hypothetical protein